VKDFGRLCRASRVGGRVEVARVPLSSPARMVIDAGAATLVDLITGGEDYEVLMTVRPDRAAEFESQAIHAGMPMTRIGRIATADEGIAILDGAGRHMHISETGWDHFHSPG